MHIQWLANLFECWIVLACRCQHSWCGRCVYFFVSALYIIAPPLPCATIMIVNNLHHRLLK